MVIAGTFLVWSAAITRFAPHRPNPTMLLHSLRTTLRHARRDSGYVFLNAGGLAIGLATCLVILMYVRTERSTDGFHENQDRIVRVWSETTLGEAPSYDSNSAHPLADLAKERFPEVELAARTVAMGTSLVASSRTSAYESDVLMVEPAFHDVFDFDLEGALPDQALGAPFTVVVTPAFASRYFGSEFPMGQTLTMGFWGTEYDFTVTGIVSVPDEPSRFKFSALASYATYEYIQRNVFEDDPSTAWTSLNPDTWLLLAPGADWRALQPKLQEAVTEMVGSGDDVWYTYFLQPLSDVHLGGLGLEIAPEGDPDTLRMFSGIALLILLIACANYMNLATARGAERAREVGVRKVFGARLWQVRVQFLVEAAGMTALALLVAAALVELAVPQINQTAGYTLIRGDWLSGSMVLWILGLGAVTSLFAGAYPAFFLSRFNPGAILRGSDRTSSGRGGGAMRRLLVVAQFSGGIALFMMTLGIRGQMNFMAEKDLGFEQDNVLYIPVRSNAERERLDEVASHLRQVPGVVAAAVASNVPNGTGGQGHGVRVVDEREDEGTIRRVLSASPAFRDALGLRMAAGTWFREDHETDRSGFVVNETAARIFSPDGSIDGAIGLTLNRNGQEGPILGIVQDFNFSALRNPIAPLVVYQPQRVWDRQTVVLRLAPGLDALDRVRMAWQEIAPGTPFEYVFLDASLAAQYQRERTAGRLFALFSGLGIVVACLGLFGLAAFAAHQRRKEIGIRKVLGAGVVRVMLLLSREFVVLVSLSILIALPISIWALHAWLGAFAYRTDLLPWMFVLPSATALVIAVATVSGQALRAALANPVDSLRSE